jgi:hypothetical protein
MQTLFILHMTTKTTALLLALLLFLTAQSQTYLDPYTGFQLDLNNTHSGFKQLNTGVNISFKGKYSHELALQLQHSLPFSAKSSDVAFTANPSLPLSVNAAKKIQPSSTSFAIVNRIPVAGKKTVNTFYVLITAGAVYQNIKVTYNYDKVNYVILNPDKSLNKIGPYLGAGCMYIYTMKTGRFFTALNFNTPAAGAKTKFPSSFKFMAPASVTAGYSIIIKERRNASPKKK